MPVPEGNSRGSCWLGSILHYTFVRVETAEVAKLREGRNGTVGENAAQTDTFQNRRGQEGRAHCPESRGAEAILTQLRP